MEFPPEHLQTPRLYLRRPIATDAPKVFAAYAGDPQVTRYLAWAPHRSSIETSEFLQQVIDAWDLRMGHRAWVIQRQEDDKVMGSIGCNVHFHRVEIGFALGTAFWGHGYMVEALRRVCEAAFADARLHRVQAICDEENTRSARVMEKAGLSYEGRLRRYGLHPNRSGEPRDCRIYSLVRGD